ncbi:MAG: hypothetical protein QN229_00105 [Desulfurococcaceae archaeon TW002]
MTIIRSFEAAIPLSPDDVMLVLGDLRLYLGLWSFNEVYVDKIHEIRDNEGIIDLVIGDTINRLNIKLKITSTNEVKIIELESQGDIYLLFRLDVSVRGLFTLLTGRLTVKSSFFKERRIESALVKFLDNLRRKMMYELPLMVEPLKRGKAAQPQPPQPAAELAKPAPAVTPTKEEVKAVIEEVKPPPTPPPKPLKPTEPSEELRDPRELEDEVLLSMIILKSQLISSLKREVSGENIISLIMNIYKESKTRIMYTNLIDDEGNRVKALIREGNLTGFRVEKKDGSILNGKEALVFITKLGRKSWRIYVYSVPM